MPRTYLGTSTTTANVALDTAAVPVVATTADRATAFPSPTTNQRVHNLQTGAIERWNGSAWVTAFSAAGVPLVANLEGGTFGANATSKAFTFPRGLTVEQDADLDPELLVLEGTSTIGTGRVVATYTPSGGTPGSGGNVVVTLTMEGNDAVLELGGPDAGSNVELSLTADGGLFRLNFDEVGCDGFAVLRTALTIAPAFYDTGLAMSAAVATTVGAAGGASALPATPLGYFRWFLDGTEVRVPYYPAP